MVGFVDILELIKSNGLAVVMLLFFVYMYIKNNKDTLELIITIKDENNKIQDEHKESVYVLRDELKEEICKSTDKLVDMIRMDHLKVNDTLNRVDGRVDKIEMYFILKKGKEL